MKLLLTILFALFSISLIANDKIIFDHITQSNGLPSNNVVQIFQDSDGLMWFATYNGLAKYDGYKFTTYNSISKDSTSLNHDIVLSITEESDRFLWIGTLRGFCKFDKELNKFTQYKTPVLGDVGRAGIRKMVVGKDGKLWLGTNIGLAVYDEKQNELEVFSQNRKDTTAIVSSYVLEIYFDNDNKVWLGTRNGLDVFDLNTREFTHVFVEGEFEKVIPQDGGVLVIDRFFNRYFFPDVTDLSNYSMQKSPDLPGFVFTDYNEDYLGYSWYGVREYGLYRVDNKTGESEKFSFKKYNKTGINSNVPQCICVDRDNGLWIGTYDGGINYYSPYKKPFYNITDNFKSTGLMNNKVKTIFEDRDGDIWIGTKVGGQLSKFNIDTHEFSHFRHDSTNPKSLSDEYIFAIEDAEPGYLWVGTMLGGINHLNKETGECTIYKHDPLSPTSISGNNIKTLCVDGDKMWIALHRLGLDQFDLKTRKKIKNYTTVDDRADEKLTSISSNSVNDVYRDTKGNMWFATWTGLSKYNSQKDNFKRYNYRENDPFSISDNMVFCIHEDGYGNLWFGTKSGLSRYVYETDKFEVFNVSSGLPTNAVYGIVHDKKGNLWISTNIGICKFNWRSGEASLYTVEDGLQSNEFVPNVFASSKDGYVFFGGNEGFTYFRPDEIRSNPNKPKIMFTDFKVFNRSVKLDDQGVEMSKHISKADTIYLSYLSSVFSIEYAALNFNSTSKNQYAYKLEGFDKEWLDVGTQRSATYTNLNPGEYVFRVKASNNDGVWNEEGIALHIIIVPPFWETWWFRLILIFALVIVVMAFIRYRNRSAIRKRKLLEAMVDNRTIELNEANKELISQKEEIQVKSLKIITQRDEIKIQKESLEKASKKLSVITRLGQELTTILEIGKLHERIYKYLSSVLEVDIFGIGLHNEEQHTLHFEPLMEKGYVNTECIKDLSKLDCISVWSFNHQKKILLNDIQTQWTSYLSSLELCSQNMPGAGIFLPLSIKGKKLGVVTIQSFSKNTYTDDDIDTLQTLSSYLAIAIDNANVHKTVKKQKDELESQHIILEKQVKERTKDLESAKLKAEESDQLKSSFLANMSHEIRTPLNSIVGFSNMLIDEEEIPADEKKKMCYLIEHNSYSLLNIISDIIDFSKIEAGQMDIAQSDVEVEPLMLELCETFSAEINKYGQDKNVDIRLVLNKEIPSPIVYTDPYRLKQIFNNLIGNAIKFTKEGAISIGCKGMANNKLIFFVKDTGIGIKKEFKDVVFERFRKIEDENEALYRGTGLGLSICQFLVELLGGEIWVESEYGKGSEFFFSLPIAQLTKEDTHVKVVDNIKLESPDWSGKKILIVEDESSNYQLLSVMLRSTNVQIIWAKSGEEGIELFNKYHSVLFFVLLDIKLPHKDGFDVIKEIRKVDKSLKVIAQTAFAMQNDENRIREAGFDAYLAKPFNKKSLFHIIRKTINNY